MQTAKQLTLDLKSNALDSLTHAVDHFLGDNDVDLKHAVLNFFQGTCLFLKLRLAAVDPKLIFIRPDRGNDPSAQTVGLQETIKRLRAAGIDIDADSDHALDAIRVQRNRIEHHQFTLDVEEVEDLLGQGVRFLEEFLHWELGMDLRDYIDSTTYSTLADLVYTYEEKLNRAKAGMTQWDPKREPDVIEAICPECCNLTIAHPDHRFDHGMVGCHFCGETFYADECVRCGGLKLSNKPEEPGDLLVCDDCWEFVTQSDD